MTQIKAKYQVKNVAGTYDQIMFETLGSQVLEDASHRFATDIEKNTWNTKASTEVVTTTANGLMAFADKNKLNGIAAGANVYTHPATHSPSIILQDASNRFTTDAEKTTWNAKASTAAVTTTANGLMTYADKVKLNGIVAGATAYAHPPTHAPSVIAQDASNRFVTDTEKATWRDSSIVAKSFNIVTSTPASSYIKYADGRMVQWGWADCSMHLANSVFDLQVTFPVPFSKTWQEHIAFSVNYVSNSFNFDWLGLKLASCYAISNSAGRVVLFSESARPYTMRFYWKAEGWWN